MCNSVITNLFLEKKKKINQAFDSGCFCLFIFVSLFINLFFIILSFKIKFVDI
jgi:hypothetical protein